MTRYVLMVGYAPDAWPAEWQDAARRQANFEAHHAFEAYVDQHGIRHSSAAIGSTDTATTVRHRTEVTDGPIVESAETIGGYYDVDLPDLDHAIEAARLLPSSYLVEIRPVISVAGAEPS